MRNTVVIDGELSLVLEGYADGSLIIPESGEAGASSRVSLFRGEKPCTTS